jgi:hypothetical protein
MDEIEIKTICAWCNKVISEGKGESNDISHGICEDCYSSLLSSEPQKLKSFLDSLEIPLIVVKESGRAEYLNHAAEKLTGKKSEEASDMLGGNIFGCIHSMESGGCGGTIHCKSCTIRNSVEHTFRTGESLMDIPATLTIRPHATNLDAHSFISTIRKEVGKDTFVIILTIRDFEAS